MSGSKLLRLCSLFLCLLLCLANFSVVANAAEGEDNLVDSNLSNWVDYGESSSLYQSANVSYLGNNTNYITVSGSNKVVVLYDLTEFLKIGESYEFSFSLPNTEGLNNNSLNSCNLSWYLCDGSNTEFPIAGEEIFRISINNSNKSNYLGKTTAFEFTYTQGFKNTCLCLSIFPGEDLNAYNYLQLYISNVKLQRIASESEKKLDGILGWLQELYNSIINGFTNLGDSLTNVWQRITTKLGDISTNITSSITNSWQHITTKLGEVITNITGSIGDLRDRITLSLKNLGDNIINSIRDFFIPPEGFFDTWKAKFNLMLEENLGFVYQAPNFVKDIVEVVRDILQTDQEVNLVFPAVEFDIAGYHIELFKDTKVDFSFLESGIWFTLYSMYKVMLYVIFSLALIKYGMSTWERTMSN